MSLVILSFPLILVLYFACIIWVLQLMNAKATQVLQDYSALFYGLLLLALICGLATQPDGRWMPATPQIPQSWQTIWLCLLALLSGYGLFKAEGWLIAKLSSGKAQAHQAVRHQAGHWWILPVMVLIVVIEELIWRGYLPSNINEQWQIGGLAAAITASVAFGLHHLFYGWIHVLLKSGYGLLWLLFYQATGTLWAPVLSHLAFNVAVYYCRDKNAVLSPCPEKKAV
ncbi:CPBP family intramembrane metalloprotease [Rheinheimera riviphila]|uniref:CPBP family intramembrane metalloprotease n=1 Tax=Rheinheimera riviphila TaxID=1834037 RepID=A0A437R5D2_9GAMM|nr:CPBP family intramembrane glutamic endopeptidase [Rheinheimera riviphila]RVU41962.1 CPBP family intramembrane metalloprotease [Rheinheimera riviphila]